MTNATTGHFFVGELPDGRFVATSTRAPYFCFRAENEEAVLQRVAGALATFANFQGGSPTVKIKSISQTVTKLRPTRKVQFSELIAA